MIHKNKIKISVTNQACTHPEELPFFSRCQF
jgi:hypothetical protein